MTWRIEKRNRKSRGVKNDKGVMVDPPEWSDVEVKCGSLMAAIEISIGLVTNGAPRVRAYAPGGVDAAVDVTTRTLPELVQALGKMRRNAA